MMLLSIERTIIPYYLAALLIVFGSSQNHVSGLAVVPQQQQTSSNSCSSSRRAWTTSAAAATLTTAALLLAPCGSANAASRLVLNEDGEYEEVAEGDWQSAWKERLDKASSMTTDQVFASARGAANSELRKGPESDASRKRRAMSGCRDTALREKAGVNDMKDCTARVLNGNVDFILNVM